MVYLNMHHIQYIFQITFCLQPGLQTRARKITDQAKGHMWHPYLRQHQIANDMVPNSLQTLLFQKLKSLEFVTDQRL